MSTNYLWINFCCIVILHIAASSLARDLRTAPPGSIHRRNYTTRSPLFALLNLNTRPSTRELGAFANEEICQDKYLVCRQLPQRICYSNLANDCAKRCNVCKGRQQTTTTTTTAAPKTVPTVTEWNVWSECSRTCGNGTRHKMRPCLENSNNCVRVFQDCSNGPCPTATCQTGEEHRYSDTTSCCKVVPNNECGVPRKQWQYKKIIGGRRPTGYQWPWMVRIQTSSEEGSLCGGSIVDGLWIVTAAHCVLDRSSNEIRVFVRYDYPDRQNFTVESIVVHPEYNHPASDIALLKLSKRITFTSTIQPICLPQGEEVEPDTVCYAAGWGLTENRRASEHLLQVGLRKLPSMVCEESLKYSLNWENIKGKTLCAGRISGGKDTCLGDSGGPLMCQRRSSCSWFLAGVTSFGPQNCGARNNPGFYTDVVKYEKWIRENVS